MPLTNLRFPKFLLCSRTLPALYGGCALFVSGFCTHISLSLIFSINFSKYFLLQVLKSTSTFFCFQNTYITLRNLSEVEISSSSISSEGISSSCISLSLNTSQPKCVRCCFSVEKSSGVNSCVVKRKAAEPSDFDPKPVKYVGRRIIGQHRVLQEPDYILPLDN